MAVRDTTRNYLLQALLLSGLAASVSAADLFILRSDYANGRQGIIRFDPAARAESPFADFIYAAPGTAFGGLELTSIGHRLIAKGAAFYDFDASSGNLLRRYPALASPNDSWGFHGIAVGEVRAKALGILPGFYGSVVCPPAPGPNGEACTVPETPFPGYVNRNNLAQQHVFLRRGLKPADTELSVVKLFSPLSAGGDPWGQRQVAVDPDRRLFFFSVRGTRTSDGVYSEMLTSAPIEGGTVGEETVIREEPSSLSSRYAQSFAYDHRSQTFFYSFVYRNRGSEFRLVQRSNDGIEEDLKVVTGGAGVISSVAVSDDDDPETYEQLIPVIGETPGANNTYWRSDAWFFNPSDEEVEVTLQRVTRPDATYRFGLAAKASRKIENIMRELGGGVQGDGILTDAVVVNAPYHVNAQLSVYSRTYTTSASGGTYGQAVPAVPTTVGYTNHLGANTQVHSIAETPSIFVMDKRDPQQYRHNFGVVNTGDSPLTLRLRYATVSLLPIGDANLERTVTVPPHATRQYTIEALFPAAVVETLPPYIVVTGDRPAALWFSMIDNLTGDGTFVPFTLYGLEADSAARLAIPAVANTPGAEGTFWRTDVYGVHWGRVHGHTQSPTTNFYPAAGPCPSTEQRLRGTPGVTGVAGEIWETTYQDVVHQFCPDASGVIGGLEVNTGSWMSMFSRTYTKRGDGGTYGEILPLYPARGWRVRHFAGIEANGANRINVGLYNGGAGSATTALRLYTAEGRFLRENVVQLAPHAFVQSNLLELFGAELADGLYALSVITLEGEGSWPYVATVDNITGDPTNWW